MSAPVLAVLLIATGALVATHLLALHRAAPLTATGVLLLALLVRALVTLALSVLALLRLSEVGLVERALDWCWHELLPDLPGALGFAEHSIAHAVVAAPLALLLGSVTWLLARHLRAWLRLRRCLTGSLGDGPWGSTVVSDDRVLLAVTRWGRGRVLVSDRALGELDRGELAAGITHELAHLRRRHRAILIVASLLGALARPLPGTRATEHALAFQLERDADEYAVHQLDDPLALASAICKTGGSQAARPALVTLGGTGPTVLRVRELLEGDAVRSRRAEVAARVAAVVLALCAVGLAASTPIWAAPARGETAAAHHCGHRG